MGIKIPNIDVSKITDPNLAQIVTQLLNIIEKQEAQIGAQQKEIQLLKAEIARLKGLPKKPHFSNQKQQPFSVTSLLNNSSTPWHKMSKKGKLSVDRHVTLPEEEVCTCGSHDFKVVRTTKKIVQGLLLERNNTAYHGRIKQCKKCGKMYKSHLPKEIRGISFDPVLRSLVSYFKHNCRITYPLMHRMLTGFGIQISYGELTEILHKNSKLLSSAYHHLHTVGYKKSSYLQSDATGAKRQDKETGRIINQYVQVVSHKLLSVFTITDKYNIPTLQKLLGRFGRDKPYASDDGSPNGDSLTRRVRQLCWVHEIRHYQKLFPFFNPYQRLKVHILTQLSEFYHEAKDYGTDPTEGKKKHISDLFDQITSQVTGYDLLDKQLALTQKKKAHLLTFLDYSFLPIHNNQCEQDVREFVIQRKISGSTKSRAGDRSIERHLSIIQTAQKQGLDIFQTLHGLISGQLSPAVLTAHIY